MNEQLQQALTQIIEKASAGIDSSVDFLSQEIPDVVHQLLLWKMTESLVMCAIAVVLVGISVWLAFKCLAWQAKAKADHQNGEAWCFFSEHKVATSTSYDFITSPIPIIMSAIPAMFALGAANLTWLKIYLAPKLYLIEYAATLVK